MENIVQSTKSVQPSDPTATAVEALKSRARDLHRDVKSGQAAALKRLRMLADFRSAAAATMPAAVKRRHCLAVIAREFGFRGWPHAVQVLAGERVEDFGTLLYPQRCGVHINIWSASYDEAKQIQARHGGFLLAYKRQYLIVDDDYIRTLGLEPRDPDFDAIDRDWAGPEHGKVRARLYGKVIAASSGAAG
ncbi:MAG: hypothetical protein O3A21_02960 [Proteobacteria bacterium]|nr:hypothetical protein [Pseudomonadota bacterium]